MVCVTLSEDDQTVLIDIEDEETEECDNHDIGRTILNIEDVYENIKIVKQEEKSENQLFVHSKKVIAFFISFWTQFVHFPFTLYNHYLYWKLKSTNDFIIVN